MAFFVSSRGLTNEAYYSLQKLARIAGTATRRQLRAALPRGVGVGPQGHHRLGRADLLAHAT